MADALGTRPHDRRTTAHKRMAADVAKVAQAVAEFRLLQRLREFKHTAAATSDAEFHVVSGTLDSIVADTFKPATAPDEGVIAFIGEARPQVDAVQTFVKALARVYRVFSLSEASRRSAAVLRRHARSARRRRRTATGSARTAASMPRSTRTLARAARCCATACC